MSAYWVTWCRPFDRLLRSAPTATIGLFLISGVVMRLFGVFLLCLLVATCASDLPRAQVVVPASNHLAGLSHYQLIRPEQALTSEAPFTQRYAELSSYLEQALNEHGFTNTAQAQVLVFYWLAVQDRQLEFAPSNPSALVQGPYQAIHRLRDRTGTLRVRLTDLNQQVLWEGTVDTGLSPERDRAELLQQAVEALLRQLPQAQPAG